jgi:hypothetical protein
MGVRTLKYVCAFVICLTLPLFGQQETPQMSQDESIPAGARVYIGSIEGGYDIYLSAAIHKKEVPLVVIADKSKSV